MIEELKKKTKDAQLLLQTRNTVGLVQCDNSVT